MDRSESRVCSMDCDYLDSVHQTLADDNGGSSSSGYDSSDFSDEEPAPIRTHPVRPTASSKPTASTVRGDVMMFRGTGDLQDSLAFILDMPEMCDVTFLVGKKQVPVHGVKAILATRSRCLYQMILQHQRKMVDTISKKKSKKHSHSSLSDKLVISVMDYQVEDFRKFITFVHSGKVNIHMNSVIGLLCAASEFQFPDLQAACMNYIRRCRGQGQRSTLLDSAWDYQHKRVAQKLICQLTSVER